MIWKLLRAELAKTSSSRLVAIVWIGSLLGILLHSALFGGFIANSRGQPIPGEFLAIWSAGQLMASGNPAAAYDVSTLHQLQIADAGRPFGGYFMWLFAPPFLLVAALLATLPFVVAYIGWATVTLLAYLACVDRLFRERATAMAYGLSPAAFLTFIVAQNGLLVAALFGGVLLTLSKRPIVSGLLLAALVVKPQLGMLFPIALVAGGYWRTLATATIATGSWILAWYLADPATLVSFQHALFVARDELLTFGHQGWYKLQSVYGLLRTIGLNDNWASAVSLAAAAFLSATVFLAWRNPMSFWMKGVVLTLCSLGITPYLYVYDLTLLTIAIGLLWRDAKFDSFERATIAGAYVVTVACVVMSSPLGPFAIGAIAVLVFRRLRRANVVEAVSVRTCG